eukprot:TRINITY_DN4065_c0_g1_i1.p1 TRINITY_DN4065_c0_g1~~TRINITY_DN4065_c0_g1_i1.p1  ORF type:complete len:235 (+),score=57.96 TRINITY_DN4065_c0_g1_i1:150-854(+)
MGSKGVFEEETCFEVECDVATKETVRQLLKSGVARIDNSYKNFHVRGMHYINLQRNNELTVKLYLIDPSSIEFACDKYLVSPHDHGYDFKTIVLRGWMRNITFEENDIDMSVTNNKGVGFESWNEFEYFSPLSQKNKERSTVAEHRGLRWLREASNTLIPTGGSYALSHRQVHTITVATNQPTLLLLFQKRDAGKNSTKLYLRTKELSATDGTYQRFTEEEFQVVLETIDRLLL